MAEKKAAANMLVKVENLDSLLTLAGDVIIASSNLGIAQKTLQQLYDGGKPVDKGILTTITDISTTSSDISSSLHHLVQAIRTMDLKDLSFRTKRLVRDLSRKTGKRVNFVFEGEETTVDKTIVEKLYDPISHQLRNALDHGIEDSAKRAAVGKPEEGQIILRAYNTEHETFIEIEDDGGGVSMASLRQKGITEGIVSPEDAFTEDDALRVMCSAGVSTAQTISEISGRGVGMDVVRSNVADMGGTVSFTTKEGAGSTFTFRVPLVSAVNIVDALVVKSGKHLFGFPTSCVVSTMSIPKKDISTTLQKGEMVKYLNRLLPLYCLGKLLDGTEIEYDDDRLSVLVIEHKGTLIALKISEFYSPQKLVIIPFNGALTVDGVSGTTILGGRRLGFVIDVNNLVARATKTAHSVSEPGQLDKLAESGAKRTVAQATQAAKSEEDEFEEEPEENGEAEGGGIQSGMEELVLEIERMLPDLNEVIFTLEQDPTNSDLLNKAFRHFHTIKGNLIMIGLVKGGDTVHAVESVLDHARSGDLDMTPELMDIVMDGISYIEEVSRSSRDGTWKDRASEEILESVARIIPEPKEQKKTVGGVGTEDVEFSHEGFYRMSMYRKMSIPFYNLYVEFDSGKQPAFLVACLMYKRISEVGDVLGMAPSLVDVENGIMEGKVRFIISSQEEEDVLRDALTHTFTKHYGARTVNMSHYG